MFSQISVIPISNALFCEYYCKHFFYIIFLCAILEKKPDSEREQETVVPEEDLFYAYFCTSKTFSINVFLRNLGSAKYLCLELCAYFMRTFFCTSKTFSVNMFLHNLSNICAWNYH